MIQRIQSVFLLLLALCMVAILALPIWEENNAKAGQSVELTAFNLSTSKSTNIGESDPSSSQAHELSPAEQAAGIGDVKGVTSQETNSSTIAIAILAILSAGVALYEIFQFKNRLK